MKRSAVLVYPPSLDFMIAFMACLKAGVVAVPVYPPDPTRKNTLSMFTRVVQKSDANVALTNAEYNYAKKLSSIRNMFGKGGGGGNTERWPDDLKWIVTSSPSSSSSSSNINKKRNGSEPRLAAEEGGNAIRFRDDDAAFLQYTSGSTSDPKGVVITHGNLRHNLRVITSELDAGKDVVVVSWLPQYHDMGLIGSYLGVLYCGGSGYYMSPLSFLQRPQAWIHAVSKYRATHLQSPNFAFKLTSRKFNESLRKQQQQAGGDDAPSPNLSSVRHIINGAEPIDADGMETFYDTFCKYGLRRGVIYPTYGLAEHTVFVCSGGSQRLLLDKGELEMNGRAVVVGGGGGNDNTSTTTTTLVGCGYPFRKGHGVDLRIVDAETCAEVVGDDGQKDDAVGEIWIRSRSVAAGYYGMDEATDRDFRAVLDRSTSGNNGDNDNNKYLRTGDLGFLHEGELFVCGRLKDLIIVGGRNHYPQDIESTAESARVGGGGEDGKDKGGGPDGAATSPPLRPGCSAAFTVNPVVAAATSTSNGNDGKDGGGGGGEVVALVAELRDVPKSGGDIDDSVCRSIADEIRSAVLREHSLGLREVVLLRPRTVPKTSSGKIARSRCREAYLSGTLRVAYRKQYGGGGGAGADVNDENDGGGDVNNRTTTTAPLEIEPGSSTANAPHAAASSSSVDPQTIRNMSKGDIKRRLVKDVCDAGNIPPGSTLSGDAALASVMDSIALSQLKGMVENSYATSISDGYLFRETTTVDKLVEVIKLGYAPDDDDENDVECGDRQQQHHHQTPQPGNPGGLAGALGCPPGVVCTIL